MYEQHIQGTLYGLARSAFFTERLVARGFLARPLQIRSTQSIEDVIEPKRGGSDKYGMSDASFKAEAGALIMLVPVDSVKRKRAHLTMIVQ